MTADSPVRPPGDLDLSRVEVAQLWWFSDGAIMNPDTRERLRRSWGLCDRHTWAYFVVECELRWQPLGTATLYQDLLERMVRSWPHPWTPPASRRHIFAGHPWCPTCDYAEMAAGAAWFDEEQRKANLRQRSNAFVAGCQAEWQSLMCPWCVPTGPGIPCRQHLASGAAAPDHTVRDALAGLRKPLTRCIRSMTHDGPPPSPEANAALVATLGWFAGWQPALALAPDAWSAPATRGGGES
ncbi:MAG TPA: hypothetical protein VF444_06325 [Pseudonocardiaceae bacterium]